MKNTLPENVSYFSQSPSLKSIFLGGEGGSGKSMILTHLAMYGFKNKWILVNVPDCRKWTHDKKKVTRFYNGLYMQNEAAV